MSDGWQLLLDWLLSHLVDLQIGALEALATLVWWAEKLVNAVIAFLVGEDLWSLLLDALLDAVVAAAPDLFAALVFSPTGLFYLALSLAGVLLIIGVADRTLAEPGQVLLWAVLVSALFVSTTLGYDLMRAIEEARRWTALEAMTALSPDGEVSDLIAIPMRATAAETEDLAWALPAQFVDDFYYPPTAFSTESAVLFDSWFTGQIILELELEEEAAQEARKAAAWQGVLLAALTLAPAALGVMFGLIFATIAASVLVLLVFFLAALPLGFFSFGKGILQRIVSQYVFLWALTLAGSIMAGVLLGTGAIFLSGTPDLAAVVSYLPVLAIVAIALSYLLQLATRAMQGTLGLVTATLQATVTQGAQNTRLPDAGQVPLVGRFQEAYGAAQDVAGLAVLGVAAAATGGAGAALSALAGGALSRANPETARDAAVLARLDGDSPAARTFAAAAVSRQTLPAVAGVIAANRVRREGDGTDQDQREEPSRPTPTAPAGVASPSMQTVTSPDDWAAATRLAGAARRHGLAEEDLAALFRTVRDGMEQAVAEGVESGVAAGQAAAQEDLAGHPAFAGLSDEERDHLGRDAAAVLAGNPGPLAVEEVEEIGDDGDEDSAAPSPTSVPHPGSDLDGLVDGYDLTAAEVLALLGVAHQVMTEADAEDDTRVEAEDTVPQSGPGADGEALSAQASQLSPLPHAPPAGAEADMENGPTPLSRVPAPPPAGDGEEREWNLATTRPSAPAGQTQPTAMPGVPPHSTVPLPYDPATLAGWTLDPVRAPRGSDVAALARIRQLAGGWSQADLATLYRAAGAGLAQADRRGTTPGQATTEALRAGDTPFPHLPAATQADLARHALLVIRSLPPAGGPETGAAQPTFPAGPAPPGAFPPPTHPTTTDAPTPPQVEGDDDHAET